MRASSRRTPGCSPSPANRTSGSESRERCRHGIRARTKIDHTVLPGAVTDGNARLLDQNWAGDFNGHTRATPRPSRP